MQHARIVLSIVLTVILARAAAAQASAPSVPSPALRAAVERYFAEPSDDVAKKSLEAIKQAQSLTDKLDARLRKEVADRLKTFESVAGQPLTEAQKYLIEKQTREQIVQEQQPEAPQQQQPVQQQNPLMADVTRIAQKYNGTIVEMSDPEAASVKVNGSLGEWVESYERAVKAKADRIAPKQTPSVVDNGNPQGRIASTPVKGTAGIADGLSPIDYFKQAYKK